MWQETVLVNENIKFKYIENGSVTSVNGFKAAGIHCGLKKKRKDLALITSDTECNAGGTFTLNKVKAAPLLISQELLKNHNKFKAVLVNSGNANACTGQDGYEDALATQKYCANKLGVEANQVLISSTGVIGQRMNLASIINGIENIADSVTDDGGIDAAEAIMTTDLRNKNFAVKVNLSKGQVTIGAICKGSGMIMPNMATMLAFVTTDADIDKHTVQNLISTSVLDSFNKISVDGDTSTNDMVILMANGKSAITLVEGTNDYDIFQEALTDLCKKMSKSIAGDGEGATKLITVNVTNATSDEDANKVGKAICNSPLVKTAINGSDANWGRIISAAGYSGAEFDPAKVTIKFNDFTILSPNYKSDFCETEAKEILSNDEIEINIDLNAGTSDTTWWTCDFSEQYIQINASYRS
ncbi:MAG: bifunctional glutamate N-acetyltransferase/amino-acid acetyltransferase ArgJ [Melioribacteraceae bacterium]|nr:bifunctional glutamate N-acetyltransferase/amino-acid acetyltransferase ArgJ [Melioribacteraceae bacterium]